MKLTSRWWGKNVLKNPLQAAYTFSNTTASSMFPTALVQIKKKIAYKGLALYTLLSWLNHNYLHISNTNHINNHYNTPWSSHLYNHHYKLQYLLTLDFFPRLVNASMTTCIQDLFMILKTTIKTLLQNSQQSNFFD